MNSASFLRTILLAGVSLIPAVVMPSVAQEDHSEHMDHGPMATMSHGDHRMSPEMLEVIRERIPKYENFSDQQIALEMQMMSPNQSRYLSADSLRADTGILVLIHGFGPTGDRIMEEAVKPMGDIFPSAMSAGMSMMTSAHIQKSFDDLKDAGVDRVVVVPLVSSRRNTLMYQWQYILGMRESGGYYDVPRIETDSRVIVTDPPGGHPLITQIVLDHALELSEDPANEVVFMLAHGPVFEDENRAQLEVMARQAEKIRKLGGFAGVEPVTLQDDAVEDVRARNVERLRKMVKETTDSGKRALIVTDLLAARSIQWKVDRDLAGLDYEFSEKGVSMHPNFRQWFQETVSAAL